MGYLRIIGRNHYVRATRLGRGIRFGTDTEIGGIDILFGDAGDLQPLHRIPHDIGGIGNLGIPVHIHGGHIDRRTYDNGVVEFKFAGLHAGTERRRKHLALLRHPNRFRVHALRIGSNYHVSRPFRRIGIVGHRNGNLVAGGSHRNPILGGLFWSRRPCQLRIAHGNDDLLRRSTLPVERKSSGVKREGEVTYFGTFLRNGDTLRVYLNIVGREGKRTVAGRLGLIVRNGDRQRLAVGIFRHGNPRLGFVGHGNLPPDIFGGYGNGFAGIAGSCECKFRGRNGQRRFHLRLLRPIARHAQHGGRKGQYSQNFFHRINMR